MKCSQTGSITYNIEKKYKRGMLIKVCIVNNKGNKLVRNFIVSKVSILEKRHFSKNIRPLCYL